MNFLDERLPKRFWNKVMPCPMTGCWLWIAANNENGYGVLGGGPRSDRWMEKAHRHSYRTLVGEIPDGLELDHLCRVRCCVNPDHLEPVTRVVNMARSPLTPHMRKFATHCKRGHEFTTENTIRAGRQRTCRECMRIRYHTTYKAQRAMKRAAQ